MKRATRVLVALCMHVSALAEAKAPAWPRFSWDTTPVFYHSCNFTGPYTDAGVKIMAKFPMVRIAVALSCGAPYVCTLDCSSACVFVRSLNRRDLQTVPHK